MLGFLWAWLKKIFFFSRTSFVNVGSCYYQWTFYYDYVTHMWDESHGHTIYIHIKMLLMQWIKNGHWPIQYFISLLVTVYYTLCWCKIKACWWM